MSMIGFHFLFPDEAANECRTVTPLGRADLPSRTFVFMEAYCAEPRCDCRRVMLNVIDAETHDHVATINYAFEPPKPPFDDAGQMFLDPLNPQTELSPAFLELAADMIAHDRAYHDRLVLHYTMWKGIVDDPSHPGQGKIRALRTDGDSSSPEPVRRSGPKIGPTIRARAGAVASTRSAVGGDLAAMPKTSGHKWQFKARFRRHAFGWKSQPAITRVREAVSEIKQVARTEPVSAAEGAVAFLERISPALENVDSSSGAIGTAVNNAIAELVPVVAAAPADATTRAAWLERLFEAHGADQIPYIERLADFWGELCGSTEVASEWGDRLIGLTRMALSPDKSVRGYFHGTSACLSALFAAERYDEIVDLVQGDVFWPYKRWAVEALMAQGRKAEAIHYAESCRSSWASDRDIDGLCEQILLSSGQVDEAYARYAVTANRAGTYLAWFRAVAKKYPHKPPAAILSDLVRHTPGDEGKWFAAAKQAWLFDEAIALANRSPCDPKTLTRAARDFAGKNPAFATEAGMAALHWLVQGYRYEVTSADVWAAYSNTIKAAENAGRGDEIRTRIRALVDSEPLPNRFVMRVIGRELGLV